MKLNGEQLNDFLKELTYASKFRVLDIAKDKDELTKVAEKAGLSWPAPDLAIFKSKYAFTDQKNLNGCRLPKEEVAKSLGTLNGKPIDIDHVRSNVIGHYLYGELVDDIIYAYGVLYKNNFSDQFKEIEDLMNEGTLKTSFEAFGDKEYYSESSYDLKDIVWAGGGLLVDTTPAFPGAAVTEMANKRVLEFAKVMTPPRSFIRGEKVEKAMENKKFYVSEFENICRLVDKLGNPEDETDVGFHDIDVIDFTNGKVKTTWVSFKNEIKDKKFNIDVTPRIIENSNVVEKKITKIELVKADKEEITSSEGDNMLEKSTEEKIKMEEKIKELEAKITELSSQLETKNAELATLTTQVAEFKTQVESANATVETLKQEKEVAIKDAKEKATLVANRKAELGNDYSKDLSDEDILDEVKFENAKLKKEVAELKKVKTAPVAASVTVAPVAPETPITVGSKEVVETDIAKKQKKVREFAFGS